jgi:topoisomerase-4 subunit A
MGNRVSQHTVQSITLIEPDPTEEEVVEKAETETTEDEIELIETKTASVELTDKSVQSQKEKPVESTPKVVEPKKEESDAKPPKKIDFEITNPDDIDIDDKGQLGLF